MEGGYSPMTGLDWVSSFMRPSAAPAKPKSIEQIGQERLPFLAMSHDRYQQRGEHRIEQADGGEPPAGDSPVAEGEE